MRRTDGDVRHLLKADALDDVGGAVVIGATQALHQALARVKPPALLRHGHHRQAR